MSNPIENKGAEETIQSKNLVFLKQNPVNETIQLIYEFQVNSAVKLELLSINGQLIRSYNLSMEQHQFDIDVHDLSSGLYLLYLKSNQQYDKKIKVSIVH